MKKILLTITILISTIAFSQGVGIGTTNPHVSSLLDITSTTKGFLPPRMTKTERDAIANPANGLIVFCTNCNTGNTGCITANFGTPAAPSWECVGVAAPVVPSVSAVCNGFVTGNYVAGFATNGTYTVTVTNNSFSTATLGFQSSDLQLSGVSGFSVGTPTGTPALTSGSATLNAGQSVTVSYPITGNSSATGTLKGDWSKLTLSCSATKNVTGISALLANNYCTNASVNGRFVSAVALTGTNTFKVTLTNISGSAINGLPAPSISNLVLSYDGTGTMTVASVTPSATFNLANNASQEFVYTLSGTPTSVGTLSLNWNYADLSCSKTRYIGLGDATFTNSKNNIYVFSVNDPAVPLNSQGTLAVSTTVSIPYTGGSGSYIAYSSPFTAIPSQFCEDGASDWTFGYSYSAGTFASTGSITATLITKKAGVITAWQAKRVPLITTINFDCVNLPLVFNNNTYPNTVGLDEGGDAIRGSLSTSGAAYDNANVNDLVKITLAEYNNMNLIVPGIATGGVQNLNLPAGGLGGSVWAVNGDGTNYKNLVTNSYVAAIAIAFNNESPTTTMRIGCSPSVTSPVTSLSNETSFSGLSNPSLAYLYFAVKRPSTHCGSNIIFVSAATNFGSKGINSNFGANAYNTYTGGGIPTPNTTALSGIWTPTQQFKYSTQKSW